MHTLRITPRSVGGGGGCHIITVYLAQNVATFYPLQHLPWLEDGIQETVCQWTSCIQISEYDEYKQAAASALHTYAAV